jgi:transcriptional regulator with XRE-family HTH domain
MFRQLASLFPNVNTGREALFNTHPLELAQLLEVAFELGRDLPPEPAGTPNTEAHQEPLGHPNHRSDLEALLNQTLPGSIGTSTLPGTDIRRRWDHLIYAYMIENTRIYEIFRRVLFELLHGEKLGTPIAESQAWLRATEALFYKDATPFQITSVTSSIRKELESTACNAYQRMFGMDLNHAGEDGKPYPYVKAAAANSEFVATFEEFLREVWVGISYVSATSSSNPTDDSKISELAEKLHDMLRSRRQNGNLSREEFTLVSMMSWFHMTVEFDSPIVRSLRAEATGVEQRLFKIAERVGVPAHGLSKNFFDIADPMSFLLIEIEKGRFNDASAARTLYARNLGTAASPIDNPIEPQLRTIITHWTAITGRDVKARKVAAN